MPWVEKSEGLGGGKGYVCEIATKAHTWRAGRQVGLILSAFTYSSEYPFVLARRLPAGGNIVVVTESTLSSYGKDDDLCRRRLVLGASFPLAASSFSGSLGTTALRFWRRTDFGGDT
jgi:hypothetical protein